MRGGGRHVGQWIHDDQLPGAGGDQQRAGRQLRYCVGVGGQFLHHHHVYEHGQRADRRGVVHAGRRLVFQRVPEHDLRIDQHHDSDWQLCAFRPDGRQRLHHDHLPRADHQPECPGGQLHACGGFVGK